MNALRFFVDAGRGATEVVKCEASEIYPGTDSYMTAKVNLGLKSKLKKGSDDDGGAIVKAGVL